MAEEKPLTKSELIAALKEIGVATQSDLTRQREEIKKDTDDAIHHQLTEFYAGYVKPEFEKLHLRIGKVEDDVREIKTELSWVKSEIQGLKAEFAATPSRTEFEALKTKVERLRPTY